MTQLSILSSAKHSLLPRPLRPPWPDIFARLLFWLLRGRPGNVGASSGFPLGPICSLSVLGPSLRSPRPRHFQPTMQSVARFASRLRVVRRRSWVREARPRRWLNHSGFPRLRRPLRLSFPLRPLPLHPAPRLFQPNPGRDSSWVLSFPFIPFVSSVGQFCLLAVLRDTAWLLSWPHLHWPFAQRPGSFPASPSLPPNVSSAQRLAAGDTRKV